MKVKHLHLRKKNAAKHGDLAMMDFWIVHKNRPRNHGYGTFSSMVMAVAMVSCDCSNAHTSKQIEDGNSIHGLVLRVNGPPPNGMVPK